MNYTNYQATHLSEISEPTIIKIKDKKQKKLLRVDTTVKIGGEGVEIQIDRTEIRNSKIKINPYSTYHNNKFTQWFIRVLKIINIKLFSQISYQNKSFNYSWLT
ncbi:hypothetical protein DMUE_5423 [Dictyocoela muelleri]|nr:hypothetical protein DMUE_5423 [Dictyocoela muelleri]